MIALAAQIRILFVLLVVGAGVYLLWRLMQRAARDPYLRQRIANARRLIVQVYLLRMALPLLLRLLRLFR